MFYCNDCAEKNKWPETLFKSIGRCECCEENKECNERKSSMLPIPNSNKDKIEGRVIVADVYSGQRYFPKNKEI